MPIFGLFGPFWGGSRARLGVIIHPWIRLNEDNKITEKKVGITRQPRALGPKIGQKWPIFGVFGPFLGHFWPDWAQILGARGGYDALGGP